MTINHVERGRLINADQQNELIDQVNENTNDIALILISDIPTGGGGSVDLEEIQDLIDDSVETHVNDTTPHPVYDDLPSLTLIFQNGLI